MYLYIRMFLVLIVTLYTSRVILHALGAVDYGIYNAVGGIVAMMAFLNSALSSSSSRFLTYELGRNNTIELNKTFSASLNLHIVFALIVVVIAETIGLWFLYNKLVIPEDRMIAALWVYQCSIVVSVISFIQVPYNASLIAHENMSIYALVGLYEAISSLAIVFLINISPIDKLVFYAILIAVNKALIQTFYLLYSVRHYSECRFRRVKDSTLYKKLLNYSGWDLFGNFASVCQGQGINILLNMFFGPVVNAARAIAVQIQTGITVFVTNFLMAIRPQVVKSFAENNTERMYSLTFTSARLAYCLMLALILPVCFEINIVLRIWLGNDVPDNTNIFSVIILLTYLMETFHLASLMAYHAIGKIKLGNIVGGTLMVTALPISYFVLRMGMPAYSVFIVIFLVNLTQMFWGWYIVHRYVPFSYKELIRTVYVPTIVVTCTSIIVPLVINLTLEEGFARLILTLIGTESAILISTYFFGLTSFERKKFKSFIKNKLLNK